MTFDKDCEDFFKCIQDNSTLASPVLCRVERNAIKQFVGYLNDQFERSIQLSKFDRVGDWKHFNTVMVEYIEIPQKKYGSGTGFNDLAFYTGLRVLLWNILKYALRLWCGSGKIHDFEKIAHYAQMAWTLKERQKRTPPFFRGDVEGDYLVLDATSTGSVIET